MSSNTTRSVARSRWAAVGAAVAVTIGAGGLMSASASVSSGARTAYVPITPCRVMDTRPAPDNVGPRAAPLGAGEAHTIAVLGVNGNCTIPTDAAGVAMNVSAVQPTQGSFLTVYPADAPRPLSANLNWVAAQTLISNSVTSDISADGKVSFYNLAGSVNLVADIVGYYVDHNHDDRYFTKDEVRTLLATTSSTKVSFAQKAVKIAVDTKDTPITRLTDTGGGGVLDVATPVRILLAGALTLGNGGATGAYSQVACRFQVSSNGGAFASVGAATSTESIGSSDHDVRFDVPLVAVVDRPAGRYDARIVCSAMPPFADSTPQVESVAFSVVATPNG